MRVLDDQVLLYLAECRCGSGECALARALGASRRNVDDALDRLFADGLIRLVRRTRTSETYGLTEEGRAAAALVKEQADAVCEGQQ